MAFSKLRESLNIPIIAMSANAFGENVPCSLNVGMNAHMTKPIEIEKLVQLLWSYILPCKSIILVIRLEENCEE